MKTITSERVDGTPIEISSEVVRWRPTAHAVLLNEQRHLPGGGIEIGELLDIEDRFFLLSAWESLPQPEDLFPRRNCRRYTTFHNFRG